MRTDGLIEAVKERLMQLAGSANQVDVEQIQVGLCFKKHWFTLG